MTSFLESTNSDTLYTPYEEAIKEIKRRYADTSLKQRVIDWIGFDAASKIPFMFHEPVAVLFRHVATPNFEMARFMDMATKGSLKPIIFEYFDDKFVANNPTKRALGKMQVFHGVGKKGGQKISKHTIINFNESNGHTIREVKTIYGTPLTTFHNDLFLKKYPSYKNSLFDASLILGDFGHEARLYYKKYLALFICFGCLFETVLPNDSEEAPFINNIFMPAFEEVAALFGVKPIIVNILPNESADQEYWDFYSADDFSVQDDILKL